MQHQVTNERNISFKTENENLCENRQPKFVMIKSGT